LEKILKKQRREVLRGCFCLSRFLTAAQWWQFFYDMSNMANNKWQGIDADEEVK